MVEFTIAGIMEFIFANIFQIVIAGAVIFIFYYIVKHRQSIVEPKHIDFVEELRKRHIKSFMINKPQKQYNFKWVYRGKERIGRVKAITPMNVEKDKKGKSVFEKSKNEKTNPEDYEKTWFKCVVATKWLPVLLFPCWHKEFFYFREDDGKQDKDKFIMPSDIGLKYIHDYGFVPMSHEAFAMQNVIKPEIFEMWSKEKDNAYSMSIVDFSTIKPIWAIDIRHLKEEARTQEEIKESKLRRLE